MTNKEFEIRTLKTCDINLQFLETLADMQDDLNFSNELNEMLDFIIELNLQQFRLTNEKLANYGDVL